MGVVSPAPATGRLVREGARPANVCWWTAASAILSACAERQDIDVRFTSDGTQHTAANAGDYIYPADVRFDNGAHLLYVKASGHRAAFGEAQTWLFEYDLRDRRKRERALVNPDVLPRECPETR